MAERDDSEKTQAPKGFDDFEIKLGDVMRGERATKGKSLLDVQRELKIKASYIAAIENTDPTAFDTPGFIAGYVRSYARYLGMDAEEVYTRFCQEGDFATAHGMSAEASTMKSRSAEQLAPVSGFERDMLAQPFTPFAPETESVLSQIETRAIASSLVLVALIGAIGFGGWRVLQEVQRVQVAPVDQTPAVYANVDPLSSVSTPQMTDVAGPSAQALERFYRPQALEVPVLVARDAPIATLDPRSLSSFEDPETLTQETVAQAAPFSGDALPSVDTAPITASATAVKVTEDAPAQVVLLAVEPAWVRVRDGDGTVIFEKTLNAGEEYSLPLGETPPTLRAGNAGALFFRVGQTFYGPAGGRGAVIKNVALGPDMVTETYAQAAPEADQSLARAVQMAQAQATGN